MDLNLEKGKYLLACSYGPDSMALFDMLLKQGFDFDVVHVNYHLREESDFEEASLRQYCSDKNIKLFVYDNPLVPKANIEAICRNIRYSFFHDIYVQGSYSALLVAHHQDDLIETYLLQKERKNLVIHYGIARDTQLFGMRVIRPLLDYSKEDLINYCKDYSIPYSIDCTNLIPMYKRNKIRIDVVSKLNKKERQQLLDEIQHKNLELENILNKVRTSSNNIEELLELSDKEFAYYLNEQTQAYSPLYVITYKQSMQVREVLRSSKPNVRMVCCKRKIFIEKAYDKLFVKLHLPSETFLFKIKEPQIIDNDYFYANLLSDTSNRNIHLSDYPLTIRSYKAGDKYQIKDYQVSVRRLFIDWKMPMHMRKRWPLIVNKDGRIIYIPRYQKDFKLSENLNFYVK